MISANKPLVWTQSTLRRTAWSLCLQRIWKLIGAYDENIYIFTNLHGFLKFYIRTRVAAELT